MEAPINNDDENSSTEEVESESKSSCKQFLLGLASMAEFGNEGQKSCNLEESQSTGCCCVLFLGPYGETVPLPTLPLSQLPLRPLISGKMLHNFLLSVTTATKTVMAASNDKTTLLVP